jgi:hypothetical protein
MPRPNTGPRLVIVRQAGWTTAKFYISYTVAGRSKRHGTSIPATNPDAAQAYFQNWLHEAARAKRNGPGDPDQVRVTDVIHDYVTEHGPHVAASDTLAIAARPLMFFFRGDTIATLTPTRVQEYWEMAARAFDQGRRHRNRCRRSCRAHSPGRHDHP